MASALLASKGITANSHEAVHKLLALPFVKPAALLGGSAPAAEAGVLLWAVNEFDWIRLE